MLKLKFTYSLFILAAIFFIAKPFVGFKLHQVLSNSNKAHSVCVKSFTKRKPEYLDEASIKKTAVSLQLTNPPTQLLYNILELLGLLFLPVVFLTLGRNPLENSFYKSRFIYLLTGELII